ncbi:MAG: RdgB/HAM1 family non-canonical purine NTP pyrophosphatase [Oscillospiraceae bacterium]|nr:RdgB/HAM1 family non-canonical purine NTP pyrophosphatase [Oscillospiraceae bacterium]MCL2279386.1 RdgB/HAM1 family non-canonical purine NTP pyrophosphatase [Oscillospiraceae bacterium]
MKKFVLATANQGKVREMRSILTSLGIDCVSRDEINIDLEIEETGTTFLENATLKATKISEISSLAAIADDSGLMVEALSGEPGVYSSSFGGDCLTDYERCLFLLKKLEKTEQRRAKFVCTIVCVFPDGNMVSAVGECQGTISTKPMGTGGFGYDPVFIPDGYNKCMAELTSEEKNKISHRSIALREFKAILAKQDIR